MCSFGGSMESRLCLTNSLGTSESERVNKTEPTADLIVLGWKWNAAQAIKAGIHAAAFMVLSEHAPWGTPPVMVVFACRQVAICVESSRCAPNVCPALHGIHSPLSYRAPSNSPAQVSARTLADLERGSIRPRPRPRSVCVTYLGWRRR